MRRSLGPRYWAPPPEPPKEQRSVSSGLQPLVEGPVLGQPKAAPQTPSGREAVPQPLAAARVKPYTRGSLAKALGLVKADPNGCSERILSRARADNAEGPISSREKTWEEIALAAGFTEPFVVTPEMIFLVMGALDGAGYRSAELYLDAARQKHITSGYQWSQQLALATRKAIEGMQKGARPCETGPAIAFGKASRSLASKRPLRTLRVPSSQSDHNIGHLLVASQRDRSE